MREAEDRRIDRFVARSPAVVFERLDWVWGL
jgi:hypothetical protein